MASARTIANLLRHSEKYQEYLLRKKALLTAENDIHTTPKEYRSLEMAYDQAFEALKYEAWYGNFTVNIDNVLLETRKHLWDKVQSFLDI